MVYKLQTLINKYLKNCERAWTKFIKWANGACGFSSWRYTQKSVFGILIFICVVTNNDPENTMSPNIRETTLQTHWCLCVEMISARHRCHAWYDYYDPIWLMCNRIILMLSIVDARQQRVPGNSVMVSAVQPTNDINAQWIKQYKNNVSNWVLNMTIYIITVTSNGFLFKYFSQDRFKRGIIATDGTCITSARVWAIQFFLRWN